MPGSEAEDPGEPCTDFWPSETVIINVYVPYAADFVALLLGNNR